MGASDSENKERDATFGAQGKPESQGKPFGTQNTQTQGALKLRGDARRSFVG
jgi:hypothetical protein